MDPIALIALFLAALVNAAIPGPVLFLVAARAAQGGLRRGATTGLGAMVAVSLLLAIVWLVMMGALELGSQVFAMLRVAGVAVLVVLGLMMLTASPSQRQVRTEGGRPADLASGVVLVLSNPVNLIFFLALVPQFVGQHAVAFLQMALVVALVLFASAIPVTVAILIGVWQARVAPRGTHWAVRAGGVAMLGFAGLVAGSAV